MLLVLQLLRCQSAPRSLARLATQAFQPASRGTGFKHPSIVVKRFVSVALNFFTHSSQAFLVAIHSSRIHRRANRAGRGEGF